MPEVKPRPKILNGTTYKLTVGCGTLYIIVNSNEGNVFEVFAKLGKAGSCNTCQTQALSRAVSIGLRAGVPLKEYIDHLEGLQCNNPTISDGISIKSCPDAISQVLKHFLTKNT